MRTVNFHSQRLRVVKAGFKLKKSHCMARDDDGEGS